MLNARAYTIRQKSRLAISLSWIAGYTNVVSLIFCGVMTSHVTGNFTHFGQFVAELAIRPQQAWVPMGFCIYLVGCFFLGAVISGMMMQMARRRHVRSQYILPIAFEAVLLVLLSMGISWRHQGQMTTSMIYLLSGIACCAMGLQNATITQVSGSVVRTTHLTGVITDLGTDLVSLAIWFRKKTRRHGARRWIRTLIILKRNNTALRVAMLASIGGSFLFGVVAGALVSEIVPLVGMIPPVAFLLFLVWMDYYQPIAELKMLDPVADPQLMEHGIDKSMIPPELVIYHISPHLAGAIHQAPNITAWAEDLPNRCRVAILSVANAIHFDDETALDLQSAIDKMHLKNRHLVMSGMKPEHYEIFDRHDLMSRMNTQDLCPDLEFAVARSLQILKSAG